MNLHHDINTTTPQVTLELNYIKSSDKDCYREIFIKKDLKHTPSVNNIKQRLKSISLTKSQKCYENYLDRVPKYSRKSDDPITPRVDSNLSNSQWKIVLSEWRKKIHSFSNPVESYNDCINPVLFRPNWFSGNLSNPGFTVLTETDFGKSLFTKGKLLAPDSIKCEESIENNIEYLEELMLFDLSNLSIDNI